jgi:hypothetical protein
LWSGDAPGDVHSQGWLPITANSALYSQVHCVGDNFYRRRGPTNHVNIETFICPPTSTIALNIGHCILLQRPLTCIKPGRATSTSQPIMLDIPRPFSI